MPTPRGRLPSPTLPPPPRPLGAYARAARGGGLLFLSGMLPLRDGRPAIVGRLGAELDERAGAGAARLAAENAASALLAELGDLRRARLVRLSVFLRTTPEFTSHAAVADAASRRLADLLGSASAAHARSVAGVASLPGGMPVELELTVLSRA